MIFGCAIIVFVKSEGASILDRSAFFVFLKRNNPVKNYFGRHEARTGMRNPIVTIETGEW